MYKKQLVAQKFICLLAIISSAVLFIYSLGLMTDLYDALYSTMRNPNDLTQTSVPGSIIYYDMQGFNRALLSASIVSLLVSCLLFITNTHIRRRYYIANYVSTTLAVVCNLVILVWSHIQVEAYKAQFLQIDFEALRAHSELWKTLYTESTFWFDIHYAVAALLLISSVALVLNLIWKVNLMKEEKHLLDAGKEVAA